MNENTYFDELAEVLLRIKTKKEMKDFLVGILSPGELVEIPKRLQIVKLLKKGVSQRKITEKLNIGIATVTRGSKELQKGSFQNI